jgi:phage-related protein
MPNRYLVSDLGASVMLNTDTNIAPPATRLNKSNHAARRALFYLPGCRRDLSKFPQSVRDAIGYMLLAIAHNFDETLSAVQENHSYSGFDCKSLKGMHPKLWEIRKHDGQHGYRLVYSTEFRECMFALHAFLKQSMRTSKQDQQTILQRTKRAAVLYEQGACVEKESIN